MSKQPEVIEHDRASVYSAAWGGGSFWHDLWHSSTADYQEQARASWHRLLARVFPEERRWRTVNGPLTATIATLLDVVLRVATMLVLVFGYIIYLEAAENATAKALKALEAMNFDFDDQDSTARRGGQRRKKRHESGKSKMLRY